MSLVSQTAMDRFVCDPTHGPKIWDCIAEFAGNSDEDQASLTQLFVESHFFVPYDLGQRPFRRIVERLSQVQEKEDILQIQSLLKAITSIHPDLLKTKIIDMLFRDSIYVYKNDDRSILALMSLLMELKDSGKIDLFPVKRKAFNLRYLCKGFEELETRLHYLIHTFPISTYSNLNPFSGAPATSPDAIVVSPDEDPAGIYDEDCVPRYVSTAPAASSDAIVVSSEEDTSSIYDEDCVPRYVSTAPAASSTSLLPRSPTPLTKEDLTGIYDSVEDVAGIYDEDCVPRCVSTPPAASSTSLLLRSPTPLTEEELDRLYGE